MKIWSIQKKTERVQSEQDIIATLLAIRGLHDEKQRQTFLSPLDPQTFSPQDVGIDPIALTEAVSRIQRAVDQKESIVVYTDYDADGITGGAILWEALYSLGALVMPYVPDRKEEGYGFSTKGLDAVKALHNPSLIISVDHGITAHDHVAYAKTLGMDVIVTDHHVKPEKLPDCPIVHTTSLSGAGVAWFVAKDLCSQELLSDLLSFAAIGTIADMVPLVGPNRSIAKFGLESLKKTKRVGLLAILSDCAVEKDQVSAYVVSHMIAPRLNALGRLEHALDALRLLCARQQEKANDLAARLGLTNKERQKMTIEASLHAKEEVVRIHGKTISKKILVVAHESYNQGIIGLVAGKLVEEYYRPSIVLSKGDVISKASARSISGFNIVEAIRSLSDLLIDVGGHPLAAGFTIETKNIDRFTQKLEAYAQEAISDDLLQRLLYVDMELPLASVTESLWERLRAFEPFGLGNYEPVFATRNVVVQDIRQIGADGKHLKLVLELRTKNPTFAKASVGGHERRTLSAIAFTMGHLYRSLKPHELVDIAYTIDRNEWNGRKNLQLKLRDIIPSEKYEQKEGPVLSE